MNIKKILLCVLALFCVQLNAFAIKEKLADEPIKLNVEEMQMQEDEEAVSKLRAYLSNSDYATGNWGGLRSRLEEMGIDVQASYITSSYIMRNGRLKSTKGTYQGLFTVSLELDTEKLGWYDGGKFYISYEAANKGMSSPEFLGSYAYINGYDPDQRISQIGQLYYEHSFKDDLFNIKIGRQDANMDFHALDSGGEFVGLSYYLIPNASIATLPMEQVGVRARLKVNDNLYIKNGFYEAPTRIARNPKGFFNGENGYLDILEAEYFTEIKGYEGKYMLGGWYQTGDFEKLDGSRMVDGNYGAYFGFDQKILHALKDNYGGLNVFGQFGYTPKNTNEVPYYGGLGLVWSGIGERRKDDKIGAGFSWYQCSNLMEDKTAEKLVEVFYKLKVTNFLYLQPSVHYIVRPGGESKNSFALGLRSVVTF